MKNVSIDLLGYQSTNQLYAGSRTVVYQAIREADRFPVVIKLMREEYPTFGELVRFRNQYVIAQNLDLGGIVKPLALLRYGQGYALVMEDVGGVSLANYLKEQAIAYESPDSPYFLKIADFFNIGIQLAQTLADLHRYRVIHKDLKPANILIQPQTKLVKLIDFSISSLLPRETQEIHNPNVLEGTLAYLSPEQTGRMNRGIDYRSDFYSLGVTFYELLTGQLPFGTNDPMELVYCHIAVQPPVAHNLNPDIPPILSEIIAKLMAKNAEERYQSALGLKYDLELCRERWQEKGNRAWFTLGQRDICDRFLIPEHLYGRETEVIELLSAFNRVSEGTSELMLVAGFSGIGKTAVVNEVHKPIVRQRGYFIKGKYDQFNRNIPLSAFVQALQDLMRQLLTEDDNQLTQWKAGILTALGENAQIIIEVIPELEKIVGQQPPVPTLSGTAAQNRFNLVFQKFIQVFTTPVHPLVMFLDDLQWADSASLNLMQVLMSQNEAGYLLLIGAYRDNEVSRAHPLMLTLNELKKISTTANTITLAPLSTASLNTLVADTLQCAVEVAQPLTKLVYQKTKGNPFFSTQFLKTLHEDGWIEFNGEDGRWQCDIARVGLLSLSDDVVEFMALQLQKLPPATQSLLKLAACIGNQFDLTTLAIVSEQAETETATVLWKALQEGLILPISDVYKFYQDASLVKSHLSLENSEQMTIDKGHLTIYKFLHDRVQQAAYSLIPDDQKQFTHLQIGRLLQQATPASQQDENIFVIVNHLNQGRSLIVNEREQQELVKLNLAAGQKAKSATAYGAALDYFNTGIALLRSDRWQSQYDLALVLYAGATESAYLSTDFEQMEQLAQVVLNYAHSWIDLSTIYVIKIQACIAQNQHLRALQLAREVLEHLGVSLSEQPTQTMIGQAFQHIQTLLRGRDIQSLLELPEMTAPDKKAAMVILSSIMSAAYQVAPHLLPLLIFAQVNLSVQYGNAPESTYGYVKYGLILVATVGDIDAGYCFGQLGMNLLQRIGASKLTAKTIFGFHNFLSHWKTPAKDTLQGLLQAYSSGLEIGDIEYAALSLLLYSFTAYFSGQELSSLKREMDSYRKVMRLLRQDTYLHKQSIYYQAVLNLLEAGAEPERLHSQHYDEDKMIQFHFKTNDVIALYQIYFNKLLLSYLFQRHEIALTNANLVEQYSGAAAGLIHVPMFCFYDALVRLAVYPTANETEQTSILERVTAHQEKLKEWAVHAPSNQAHRCALVAAERCRVLGEKAEAIEMYDRAIALAKENEYIQEEALANELAAKFYLDWGKERIAQSYMIDAYYGYTRWGALAKVADLEKRHSQLLQPILQQQQSSLHPLETLTFRGTSLSSHTSTTDSTTISHVLDFTSVLKAAQAISSSLELDELIASLTRIILENSGAKKSALILPQENSWYIRAMTFVDDSSNSQADIQILLDSQLVDNCQDIPVNIVYYVKNTQQAVLIDNCKTDIPGLIGEYMLEHQPQSVFCTPIIHQRQLVGIIYLENPLVPGVFTYERLSVIHFLCSQAAISLENARLYQQVQQALQNLQQAQLQIVQSEKMSALGNLVAGVAHEMNNPLGFIAASLQQAKPLFNDIIEHLKLYQETLPSPSEKILDHAEEIDLDYSLEDLPKMIDSMTMACDRLKNISTSLRTFSRSDKDYKVLFNIHEGIDSTILILKHRLKANAQRPAIEVITDYGNLPPFECFPGQLNQVFMNILANAIDALDESSMSRSLAEIQALPNQITIKTLGENQQVKIFITDNGIGMSESVKHKIFDHLFTTKGVGKGTGLGLAIARQIVLEKHGGAIEFYSNLGQGTEFLITLPIKVS